MTRLLAATIAALTLAGVASAAAAPAGPLPLTPAQVRTELLAPSTVFYSADKFGGSEYGAKMRTGQLTAATCNGLGKAASGRYAVFSCTLSLLDAGSITQSRVAKWVRVWSPSVVCVSTLSIGACPPAPPARPLTGDPRLCDGPAFSYGYCVFRNVRSAMSAKLRDLGNIAQANLMCAATTAFVYRCTWADGSGERSATVSFRPTASSWVTTVVIVS